MDQAQPQQGRGGWGAVLFQVATQLMLMMLLRNMLFPATKAPAPAPDGASPPGPPGVSRNIIGMHTPLVWLGLSFE